MLRFRLGTIPVEVRFSHLAIALLLAWLFVQPEAAQPGRWPGSALAGPGGGGLLVPLVLGWVLLISVSVLVHELGHALTSRAFGYQPSIQLVGMGGETRPNAPGPIPWHKDVLLTLAGPLAGLMLGGAAWLLLRSWGAAPRPAAYYLDSAFQVNVFWAAINLVPVLPLDGGRITLVLFRRVFGRPGFALSQGLGVVVSAALVVASLVYLPGSIFLPIFFGMFGVRALTQLLAFLKGDAPAGVEAHPLLPMLEAAEKKYRDGELAEAAEGARKVVDRDPPPALRSRAHHLLGWVALKVGKGRLALDHFSQVQAIPVAPQALAAGFSLIGDEARALPLWEQAATESEDPAFRHELAGCLLRMGREGDARQVPGVDMTKAWAAAERIVFLRGDWARAGELAEAGFREAPTPELAYDAACAWAKAGKPEAALRMLTLASQNGFDRADLALADDDLSSLRALPEFQRWLDGLKEGPAAG